MKVQLHTDKHVLVDAELSERIERSVADDLARYGEHLTRVEVHLTDQSGGKRTGGDDVRCLMEARPAGMQRIAVSHNAPTVAEALAGAVEKLLHALGHAYDRLDDKGARETIRGH